MIAFKCAKCNGYFDGKPRGIIYDNRQGKGPRLDICLTCMNEIMTKIEQDKVQKSENQVVDKEEQC